LAPVACSDDDPVTPATSSKITGTVVDSSGDPVSGAGIMMNYAIPYLMRPSTRIQFQVLEEATVKVWITSECVEDTVRILVHGVLPAGAHSVIWDSKDDEGLGMPSGLYTFHFQIDDQYNTSQSLILRDGYEADADPEAFHFHAITGTDGTFSLDQGCLDFDYEIAMVNELGDTTSTWTVPREARFYAMHRDFSGAVSDWVTVSESTGANVAIKF